MWSSSETRTVDLLFSGFGHGVSIGSICFRVTHAAAFLIVFALSFIESQPAPLR